MRSPNYTADERKRAITYLENPRTWPMWPAMPMKRYVDGRVDTGFSVSADYPLIVMRGFPSPRGILLQLACEGETPDAEMKRIYEEHIVARYEDYDAMFDAGWAID